MDRSQQSSPRDYPGWRGREPVGWWPNKALSHGFVFRPETLRSAFDAIL